MELEKINYKIFYKSIIRIEVKIEKRVPRWKQEFYGPMGASYLSSNKPFTIIEFREENDRLMRIDMDFGKSIEK
jgi:hypothetical protein